MWQELFFVALDEIFVLLYRCFCLYYGLVRPQRGLVSCVCCISMFRQDVHDSFACCLLASKPFFLFSDLRFFFSYWVYISSILDYLDKLKSSTAHHSSVTRGTTRRLWNTSRRLWSTSRRLRLRHQSPPIPRRCFSWDRFWWWLLFLNVFCHLCNRLQPCLWAFFI